MALLESRKFILNFLSSEDEIEETEDVKPNIESTDCEKNHEKNVILTGVGFLSLTEDLDYISGAIFTCERCEMIYYSKFQLDDHQKDCVKNEPQEQVIDEPEDIPEDIESEVRECKRKRSYYCKHCKYKTTYEPDFISHLLKHKKDKNYNGVTTNYNNMFLTPRRYRGNKRFKCSFSQCFYSTDKKFLMTRHISRHSGKIIQARLNRGNGYACTECDYKTQHKSHLTAHMRVHNGERPFPCPYCPYRAPQKGCLTNHLNKHSKEKPFVCSICDYRTSYKSVLKTHVANHLGEYKYACNQCDYKSLIKNCFDVHVRAHSGEKPYICPHCPYKSSQQGSLYSHLKIHSGKRPHTCDYCHYRSNFRRDLIRHIKLKHP